MKYKEIISEKVTKASQNPLSNPLFKKWFGNSKIIDKNGLPMVVYHGTASAFEEFEVASIGKVFGVDEHGFFFTNNSGEDMASGYAKRASQDYVSGEWVHSGANVIPVFIKMERPYTFAEYMYAYEWGDATDKNIEELLDGRSIIAWFDKHNDVLTKEAIDGGYDGIFLYDPSTDIGDGVPENIVVAFKPEQIKSIFAKEFNPNSAKLSEEITPETDDNEDDDDARFARARAQGFDPDADWFHGTSKPIEKFDETLLGSTTDARNTVLGFFFTSDEYAASAYSGKRGHVIDALLRMRKPLVLKQPNDYVTEDVGAFLDEYVRDEMDLHKYPTEKDFVEFKEYLIRRGFDSIVVVFSSGTQVAIVFNANQIRDRDAQFDQSKSASPNLLD